MSNKTEILSFDEWINSNGFNFRPEQYDLYKFLYEAGQQSKQDEVDHLQKRIDDAVNCLEQNKPSLKMGYKHAINALSILKGEETK